MFNVAPMEGLLKKNSNAFVPFKKLSPGWRVANVFICLSFLFEN
jgi:hypothetical protein